MDDREKELLATYRAEAAALFSANQAGRTAAERVFALLLTVVAVAVAAGINADTADVALPLPALALSLLTYMFHQYADLAVMGVGRRELEQQVNRRLNDEALIYETALAPIRKSGRLSWSTRMLQALSGAVVAAILVVGTVVAFDGQRAYVTVGYCVLTALSAITAGVAFNGMVDAPRLALEAMKDNLERAALDREGVQTSRTPDTIGDDRSNA